MTSSLRPTVAMRCQIAPSSGRPGKAWRGEVGAHHGAGRSARVVTRVEGAARTHGNLERLEEVAADDALLNVEAVASVHRNTRPTAMSSRCSGPREVATDPQRESNDRGQACTRPARLHRLAQTASTSRLRCASSSRRTSSSRRRRAQAKESLAAGAIAPTCQDRSAVRRSLAMTPATRSQFCVSFTNCRRPILVIA